MSVETKAAGLFKLARDTSLSHAYLFEGPKGSGKLDLAVRLAQAIFCEIPGKDGTPCGTCRTCNQVTAGSYPDLFLFDDELELVPAAEARRLREWLYQSPLSGSRKVAILSEISRLSPLSQNTLLKVLEEPPGGTTIFITDSSRAAIDTIRSRAQRIWIGSSGSVAEEGGWTGLIDELPEIPIPKLFSKLEEIAALPQPQIRQIVESWIIRLRDVMIKETGRHGAEKQIRRLLVLHKTLSTNAAVRLQLEAALLEMKQE